MFETDFRGRNNNTKEWHYGMFLLPERNDTSIVVLDSNNKTHIYHVEGETVGRYTMFNDREGTPIFEGDITELELEDGEKRYFEVAYKKVKRTVASHRIFDDPTAKVEIYGVVFLWRGFELFPCIDEYGVNDTKRMKVVGNIFDNAELLLM